MFSFIKLLIELTILAGAAILVAYGYAYFADDYSLMSKLDSYVNQVLVHFDTSAEKIRRKFKL